MRWLDLGQRAQLTIIASVTRELCALMRCVAVTIPLELSDATLTLECPYCGHPLVRKGSWFKVIGKYRSEKRQSEVRIGYPDKLRLFHRYSRDL